MRWWLKPPIRYVHSQCISKVLGQSNPLHFPEQYLLELRLQISPPLQQQWYFQRHLVWYSKELKKPLLQYRRWKEIRQQCGFRWWRTNSFFWSWPKRRWDRWALSKHRTKDNQYKSSPNCWVQIKVAQPTNKLQNQRQRWRKTPQNWPRVEWSLGLSKVHER